MLAFICPLIIFLREGWKIISFVSVTSLLVNQGLGPVEPQLTGHTSGDTQPSAKPLRVTIDGLFGP